MDEGTARNVTSKTRLFVAAIDLGTTYSGWAYSTSNQQDKVYAHNWYSDCGTLSSLKNTSCVLLTPQQNFDSFGYEAESKFASLAEEESESYRRWYMFRNFKMALYDDRKLTRTATIEDISGKKMSALVVFSHAIRFLKDSFIETIRIRVSNVKGTDITYVLTVPAIWNDLAKRFMRQAGIEAGIPDDQLIIALEPEAASIWCQRIHTEVHRDQDSANLGICSEGTRYMIVDLGGGTADITVHEKRSNNTLLEVHKPSGGPWGGTEVDKSFIHLLKDALGPSAWAKYERNEVEGILDIYRQFEKKKRLIKLDQKSHELIALPSSLKRAFETCGRMPEGFEWKKDKLKIDSELLAKCFEKPMCQIISHIEEILSERIMKNVDMIMLVGGFAESPYVQKLFKVKFSHKKIIVPPECGLAVLKGAVLFGYNPSIVTARIARATYGLDIAVPFDRTKHSRENLVFTDAGPLCKNSFWKAIEIGQEIKNGQIVSRIGKAVDDNQSNIILKVVKSKKQNPKYTTEEDCEEIGQVEVKMDKTLKADENIVDEEFIFGGTEFMLRTHHRKTGFKQTLRIDL